MTHEPDPQQTKWPEPECPGPDCWMCSGERCEPCFLSSCEHCDCDVVERHQQKPCDKEDHRPRFSEPATDELSTLRQECAALREQVAELSTWGVVEIAIRNVNVKSYMDHWEGRAKKAEAECAALQQRVKELAEANKAKAHGYRTSGRLSLRGSAYIYQSFADDLEAALSLLPRQGRSK